MASRYCRAFLHKHQSQYMYCISGAYGLFLRACLTHAVQSSLEGSTLPPEALPEYRAGWLRRYQARTMISCCGSNPPDSTASWYLRQSSQPTAQPRTNATMPTTAPVPTQANPVCQTSTKPLSLNNFWTDDKLLNAIRQYLKLLICRDRCCHPHRMGNRPGTGRWLSNSRHVFQ